MKFQWLSDFDGRRDNNFTLIRLILASTVLFSHSYALSGTGPDPLSRLILPYSGFQSLAVDGFFIASGFLVTGSLVNRGPFDYAIRRALRILPGYWMMLLIFVVLIGPVISILPASEYFSHPWTLSHLRRGFYLFNGTQGGMPGVFLDHRYPEMFNGSLWTLTAEVRCYVFLGALGILTMIFGVKTLPLLLLITLVFGYFDYAHLPLFGISTRWARLGAFFALGSLAWIYREWIPLVPPLAIAALVLPFVLAKTPLFPFVLWVSLTYIVFYVAYAIKHIDLDRFGDISYGVYIYAWPVQQLVFWPGQDGAVNAILAAAIVFPVATASWFLVEKPALKIIPAAKKPGANPTIAGIQQENA